MIGRLQTITQTTEQTDVTTAKTATTARCKTGKSIISPVCSYGNDLNTRKRNGSARLCFSPIVFRRAYSSSTNVLLVP